MDINIKHGEEMVVALQGRLDTTTSQELEAVLEKEEVKENLVVLEFSELEYISSAGLRLLLSLKKKLEKDNKKLEIRNINDVVKEVFNVTGFINILDIK